MIRNRAELKEYLDRERALYFGKKKGALLAAWLMRSKMYRIWQYVWTLRHAEYHKTRPFLPDRFAFAWYHRRKNILGTRLGFEIPENCVGKGLFIYHIAPVVINEDARIGEECRITGNFCAGNTGPGTASPVLGDRVTAGWGSCVIGDVHIADDVILGAGCVVTRSIEQRGARAAGVPARTLPERQSDGEAVNQAGGCPEQEVCESGWRIS